MVRATPRRIALRLVSGLGLLGLAWGTAQAEPMPHLDGASLLAHPTPAASPHGVGVDDLMSLIDLSGVALSPDGRWVATLAIQPDVSADSYRIAWVVAPTGGPGPVVNLGDAGEPRFFAGGHEIDRTDQNGLRSRAVWARDSQSLYYLRRMDGAVQVWRSDRTGKAQVQVTHAEGNVRRMAWSRDGRRFYVETGPTRAALAAAMRSDARTGYRITTHTDWSFPDDQPFQTRPAGLATTVLVLDLANGAEMVASPDQVAEFRALGAVSADQLDPLVVVGPDGAGRAQLERIAASHVRASPPRRLSLAPRNGAPEPCGDPACTGLFEWTTDTLGRGAPVWWAPDGASLYFLRRQGANDPEVRLYQWRPASRRLRIVARFPDTLTDCATEGAHLVCLWQSPVQPRQLVSIDLTTGQRRVLFDPNPQWSAIRLGETRWIKWRDPAGRQTSGVLIKPPDYVAGRRYPLVILGYNTSNAVRGDRAARFPSHVLAQKGFVVLVYDYWQNEATLYDADYVPRRYAGEVEAGRVPFSLLQAAVKQLSDAGLVDAGRVGIGGQSDGLNPVAYGLIHSDLFKAAAVGWIRWNPSSYFMFHNIYKDQLETAGLVVPPERQPSALIRHLSLAANATAVRAPILAHASDLEFFRESQLEAVRRFEDAGRPLDMYVMPDEDHIPFHPAHRDAEFRRTTQWFQFWLQGVEAPDPVEPDQYARWRAMRDLRDAARRDVTVGRR
jgi:dipeptidyl aminopeptidase/acylaminoacyl peptidase